MVKLSDSATLKLKAFILDIKEKAGPSPFVVNLAVSPTAGISTTEIPENIKNAIVSKPLMPSKIPEDGWELLDIVSFTPAVVEQEYDSSKGKLLVMVQVDPVLASRNINYKTVLDEPVYWLSWVYKISWKFAKGEAK